MPENVSTTREGDYGEERSYSHQNNADREVQDRGQSARERGYSEKAREGRTNVLDGDRPRGQSLGASNTGALNHTDAQKKACGEVTLRTEILGEALPSFSGSVAGALVGPAIGAELAAAAAAALGLAAAPALALAAPAALLGAAIANSLTSSAVQVTVQSSNLYKNEVDKVNESGCGPALERDSDFWRAHEAAGNWSSVAHIIELVR